MSMRDCHPAPILIPVLSKGPWQGYRGMGYGPQNGVGYGVRPSESGGVRGTVLYEEGGVTVHGGESEHAKFPQAGTVDSTQMSKSENVLNLNF
jgi:hypothetical protein